MASGLTVTVNKERSPIMRLRKLLGVLVVIALVAAACGDSGTETTTTTAPPTETTTTTQAPETTTTTQAPETTTTTEAPPPAIGTAENPIQVLYVPSVSADEIVAGGELLAAELEAQTGLVFEVSVPTSYAATVEEMCASTDNTMAFIPAQAYVLANALCGVEVSRKALRFGYDVYWTQFITQRDSDIDSLDDLTGRSWAYPDGGSTSGFLVPSGMFLDLGITPGETFEAGGHTGTVRAIYNDEADFGTTFFSPPTDADFNALWAEGEDPDVPADKLEACGLDADGQLVCDGWYPQDARRGMREEAPDVIQKVRVFAVSPAIPNDTLSFAPDFPADIRGQIESALDAYAAGDPDGFAAAFDAYSWTSVSPTNDAEFDDIRKILDAVGYDLEDLG